MDILTELFTHNKTNFNTNIKKLDLYINLNPQNIKQIYDDEYAESNDLLYNALVSRNSYNMSLLLSNKLSRPVKHTCWLPSELWNAINNILKMEYINKINIYKLNIPDFYIIKERTSIGNYNYLITYKFYEDGRTEKNITVE